MQTVESLQHLVLVSLQSANVNIETLLSGFGL